MNSKKAKRLRKASEMQCIAQGVPLDTQYDVKTINKVIPVGDTIVPYTVEHVTMKRCLRLVYKMTKDKVKNPKSSMAKRYDFKTVKVLAA